MRGATGIVSAGTTSLGSLPAAQNTFHLSCAVLYNTREFSNVKLLRTCTEYDTTGTASTTPDHAWRAEQVLRYAATPRWFRRASKQILADYLVAVVTGSRKSGICRGWPGYPGKKGSS